MQRRALTRMLLLQLSKPAEEDGEKKIRSGPKILNFYLEVDIFKLYY